MINLKRKLIAIIMLIILSTSFFACRESENINPIPTDDNNNNNNGRWNGESITYTVDDIDYLNGATPSGYAITDTENPQYFDIKSLSTELDNYGGVTTEYFELDFSKTVIFQMEVISVYNQYIIKLKVDGDKDPYYVLSDEGTAGVISINVVDAMLCDKYRNKQTQPDPGYSGGFKYANSVKYCAFYIMPKGPGGETKTAVMTLKNIKVTNYNSPAVKTIAITGTGVSEGKISALKNSPQVSLNAVINPDTVTDKSVIWKTSDISVAIIDGQGNLSFSGVGTATVTATSTIDQSKSGNITVDVLSGYEIPQSITNYLNNLIIGSGGIQAEQTFYDIFNTTWGNESDIIQKTKISKDINAVDISITGSSILIENNFKASINGTQTEENLIDTGKAGAGFKLSANNFDYNNISNLVLYRCISGTLYKSSLSSSDDFKAEYAYKTSGIWNKTANYEEQVIAVWANGDIRKFSVENKCVDIIAKYSSSDFVNTNLWQDGNNLLLASGRVTDNGNGTATITETNIKDEAYGGIYSEKLNAVQGKTLQVVIDVVSVNPIRVLWDLRILYYNESGSKYGNPVSIIATSTPGVYALEFNLAKDSNGLYKTNFSLFILANGKDISGDKETGASVTVKSIKVQYVE